MRLDREKEKESKRQKACLYLLIRKVDCFHLKRNTLQDHVFVKYLGSVDWGKG